jgi:hypothetical protein
MSMEVRLWLESLNLGDLAGKFHAEGFDSLARISAITNEGMCVCCLSRLHLITQRHMPLDLCIRSILHLILMYLFIHTLPMDMYIR